MCVCVHTPEFVGLCDAFSIVSRWLACSFSVHACVCCLLVSVVLLSNLLFVKLCIYTVCVCDKMWLDSM